VQLEPLFALVTAAAGGAKRQTARTEPELRRNFTWGTEVAGGAMSRVAANTV